MRVRLLKTFEADVGSRYECAVCGADAILGYLEPVLCMDHVGPPLHLTDPHDDEELCEEDRLRNEHTREQFEELGIAITEYGHVCPDCLHEGLDPRKRLPARSI